MDIKELRKQEKLQQRTRFDTFLIVITSIMVIFMAISTGLTSKESFIKSLDEEKRQNGRRISFIGSLVIGVPIFFYFLAVWYFLGKEKSMDKLVILGFVSSILIVLIGILGYISTTDGIEWFDEDVETGLLSTQTILFAFSAGALSTVRDARHLCTQGRSGLFGKRKLRR